MPDPRFARISADIDPGTLAQLVERSQEVGGTVSMIVRQILEKYFEAEQRPLARTRRSAAKEKPAEKADIREIRGLLKAQAGSAVSPESMDEAIGRLLAEEDRRIRNEAAS